MNLSFRLTRFGCLRRIQYLCQTDTFYKLLKNMYFILFMNVVVYDMVKEYP